MADSTFSIGLDDCGQTWNGTREAADALPAADAELIAGLKRGDDASYEKLIASYEHPIYNLIYRLLSHPNDAPDVVQEVFLKVFRSVGRFRGESSLKTWIYRIAVNEAHNHRRWFHRRGQEIGIEDDQGDGKTYEQVLPDCGPSPYEVAADREARVRLGEALQQIKPVFRETLVLREIEGLSYEEIAEILGVSLGTVKSRMVRGRAALRGILTGPGYAPSSMILATAGTDGADQV